MKHFVRAALKFLLAAVLLAPAVAHAGDLVVSLTDQNGHPVEDAVVMIDAPGPPPPPRDFTINQKDMTFVPHVLVVPAGSTVDFGNLDPFRHHVYSFSPARKFELKLFGQGQTRPVRFVRPGVVSIGCNIHDSMQAFVVVVTTRLAARSPVNGRLTLRDVPADSREMRVWHPRLRAPGNQMTVKIDAGKGKAIPVRLKLRSAAPAMRDY